MKTYLQSYERVTGGFLTNGGSPYWLNVLQVSWFGLIKREKKISMQIPWSADLTGTLEKWDKLIESKTPLK